MKPDRLRRRRGGQHPRVSGAPPRSTDSAAIVPAQTCPPHIVSTRKIPARVDNKPLVVVTNGAYVLSEPYQTKQVEMRVGPMTALSGAKSCLLASALVAASAQPVSAHEFTRLLHRGDRGRDVRALEVRITGWFPRANKRRVVIDRYFGRRTERALLAYQRHYGLLVDGVAGPQTFGSLARLQKRDGSTAHFDWGEFHQNRNPRCSRRANAYAGTFRGGRAPRAQVRRHVKRLMWRLEAIRAKGGDRPIEIVSGFRSVPYNRCVSNATLSQHQYGTAADIRIAGVGGHRERRIARHSQIHGIQCYSSASHNHVDLRLENRHLPEGQFWWWPRRDRYGRDLDSGGRPCRNERKRTR